MVILVCGGRDYNDEFQLAETLDTIHRVKKITKIIHGKQRGADTLAWIWADAHGVPCEPYEADWTKFGPAAGPIRNKRMLDENPDIEMVVAFPGNAGTANMVMQAENLDLLIVIVKPRKVTRC